MMEGSILFCKLSVEFTFMRSILYLVRLLRYVQRVCDQFLVKPLIAVWCPLKPLCKRERNETCLV